ncbi:MAG: G5 domain-containing protein [Eubacterium sp.]|nr:G5 domain-containing protein [Eubacterium sp.]
MTNQSKVAGKRSLRVFLGAVVVILIVSIFTSTVFADSFNKYDVTILDNSEEFSITTNETEPIEILKTAGITLNSDDRIDLTKFEQGEGGTIKINRLNSINVEFEGNVQTYNVYSQTVGEALDEIGATVSENDKLNYSLSDAVENGMVISIKSAFSVTLNENGKNVKYAISRGKVSDLLSLADVTLDSDDYTQPAVNSELNAGMNVKVYHVDYKNEQATTAIPYKTKTVKDATLKKGTKKVVKAGKSGVKKTNYKVKYVNSKESARQKLSENVVSNPTDAVVKVGTKKVAKKTKKSAKKTTKKKAAKKKTTKKKTAKKKTTKTTASNGTVTPNGVKEKNGYKLGQVIQGRYTHYCACATCNGSSSGVTSSGKRISNGMKNPYYIACNWLPLGTVINVDGQNYTVVDRGGSGLSREGRIDIFTPGGHAECYRLGTGSCTIKIVRLGW